MDDTTAGRQPGGLVYSPEPFLLRDGERLVKPGADDSPPFGTREWFGQLVEGRHPGTVSIVRYFAWAHLPESLQQVSAPFGYLAESLLVLLPDSPELVAGLRNLLQAKDCATRAMVDKLDA
jgi:hypothetical protein